MKEIHFASEIKRSCDTFTCFYYKIPDSYMGERFLVKKPFDAFVLCKRWFMAFEFKMHKTVGANGVGAFPFDCVKEHQIEGLLKVNKAGGEAFVMINVRTPANKEKGRKPVNRTFYIKIKDFIGQKEYYTLSERKSIPFLHIEDPDFYIGESPWKELTRTSRDLKGKLCWDMEKLCDSSFGVIK